MKKLQRLTRSTLIIPSIGVIFSFVGLAGFSFFENRPIVVENNKAVLIYHLSGGSLKDFHLKQNNLNPFAQSTRKNIRYEHRLTISEKVEGHTTPSNDYILWDLANSPILKDRNMQMMMKADLLNEKITIRRYVTLETEVSAFYVQEKFYNYDLKEKKVTISQEINLNPDLFIGATVYSNIDFELKAKPKVKKEILNDNGPLSWIIISNPDQKILLGYLWKAKDYSKLTLEQIRDSYQLSFGLDNRNSLTLIDSKGEISKSYICCLAQLPKNFSGIKSVQVVNDKVVLTESNSLQRSYDLARSSIF